MPLTPPAMIAPAMGKASSKAMVGSQLISLVSAASEATCQYLMVSSTVMATVTGVGPGSGTMSGTISGASPSAMSSLMLLSAASVGMVGKDLSKFFESVSTGVVTALLGVVVQGSVVGAGTGSGTGKIIGLVPTVLQGLIMAKAASKGLVGQNIPQLSQAIATGVCTHLMAVPTVTLVEVGIVLPPVAGPLPIPTAPGVGRFA